MAKFETILFEKKGSVAWITLNRPDVRNAMSPQMREEIIEAVQDCREDNAVYVVAVTGAGEQAFCAGADISQFLTATSADQLARHSRVHPIHLIREMPKPVVAMVNGPAFGGGCELVLACDIAIASEKAQFGQLEVRVGIIPGAGGTQILPRLIGDKRAKDLIFTGRVISANEALQWGMVNQVVPHDKLRETTEKYLASLCRKSPVILKLAKLSINRAHETALSAGIASERDLFALCFSTEDQKEGARAFFEKRETNYKGK